MSGYTKGRATATGNAVHLDNGQCVATTDMQPMVQRHADAQFIAEAFTVAHETGRTPKQLADERARLLLTIEQIAAGMGNLSLKQMGDAGVHGINDGKQRAIYLEAFVRIARDVLAKVTGEPK